MSVTKHSNYQWPAGAMRQLNNNEYDGLVLFSMPDVVRDYLNVYGSSHTHPLLISTCIACALPSKNSDHWPGCLAVGASIVRVDA